MPVKFFLPSELYSNPRQAIIAVFLLRFVMLGFALLASLIIYFFISASLLNQSFAYIIALGITYSLLSLVRLKHNSAIHEIEIFVHLIIDTAFVVLLVSVSGRTGNPFIYYLLVLVALNALLFGQKWSWFYSILVITVYSFLFYPDIADHLAHSLDDFQLHLFGMWINFVGSALLINFVISVLTKALKQREHSLALAREQNLRNEQLVGLGTIAASTVHALRTPLSTIAVLLSDLSASTPKENIELKADFDLLLEQVERCKQTTNKLASLAEVSHDNRTETPQELSAFLKEHYLLMPTKTPLEFDVKNISENTRITASILLKQALLNLIDNALQAALTKVEVQMFGKQDYLYIHIQDDGEGFPEAVKQNWGKPFYSQKAGGLGIGLFLANSNIERFGGQLRLLRSNTQEGSTLEIVLPCVLPDKTNRAES